ncbi:NAD(P)/FAD-dependent oxidoreductase [Candidatus Magnetominusculus dajiuhuensis]|uniref:NAD(P)/FAD-dependent oxidoreductase n=1 Tax=Candidatus Magnetominusculus dajiuhuensis TaxID=3137712 RepID=UPI003B42BB7B
MDVDIAVIGGGPAGATAARLLSRANRETVLIERDMKNEKPCGGGLLEKAFKAFDIPLSLIKKKVESIRIVSPKGNTHDISMNSAYLAIVHRAEFDEALRGAAAAEGAGLIEGTFIDLQHGDKSAVLRIKTAAGETRIRARHIIAADGVNSMVVKRMFGKFPRRIYTAHEIHHSGNVHADDLHRRCEFRFSSVTPPGFYSWIFPHRDGISIGTGSEHADEVGPFLDGLLRAKGFTNGHRRGYFIPVWDGSLYYKNGVYFVGDAAGMVLPFTYEGIYYAMRSAEFAVAAVLKNKPGLYKKLWQETYRKRYLVMRALQRYFLRNDDRMEKLVSLYGHPHIREASMRLWTQDDIKINLIGGFAALIKKYGGIR